MNDIVKSHRKTPQYNVLRCLFEWLGTESNRRHTELQSVALPTELPSRVRDKNGGGRGIRTPAGREAPVGFQDRSLQPDLGIPPI